MKADRYRSIRAFLATSLFVAGLVFMALGWNEIAEPPSLRREATAVEHVIAARPVAISLRVALISLATYVLASVVALALEGRWLVKAGPAGAEVEPSPALESLKEANAELNERMAIVEETLEKVWESVETVQDDLDENGRT
jgi:hypothetical protein